MKQPSLFDDLQADNQSEEERLEAGPVKKEYVSFLPGVKAEEAFLDVIDLNVLRSQCQECQKCELRGQCTQVVFGDGNPHADLMFIGEGPGADEDRTGIPFVGRAGKLLDKILAASELQREEVYITNVVKCRPPGNRLPSPLETKTCRSYLEAQIRLIQPRLIVCLGAAALQTVIKPGAGIGATRGRWLTRQGIRMMATYHPAALLRNEKYKRPTWEDFKQIRDSYKLLKTDQQD